MCKLKIDKITLSTSGATYNTSKNKQRAYYIVNIECFFKTKKWLSEKILAREENASV